jgi:hypothetical protein
LRFLLGNNCDRGCQNSEGESNGNACFFHELTFYWEITIFEVG